MEINSFLEALDSYPIRAAEEPNLIFQQYLTSFFVRGSQHPRESFAELGSVRNTGLYRLAGGTMPFMRRYTTICP